MSSIHDKNPTETPVSPKSFLEFSIAEAEIATLACTNICTTPFVETEHRSIYESLQRVGQRVSVWLDICKATKDDYIDIKEKDGRSSAYLPKETAIARQLDMLHKEFSEGRTMLEIIAFKQLKLRVLNAINVYLISAGYTIIRNEPNSPLAPLEKATSQNELVAALMDFNAVISRTLPKEILTDAMNVVAPNQGPAQTLYAYIKFALEKITDARLAIEARQEEEMEREMNTIKKLMSPVATQYLASQITHPKFTLELLTPSDKQGNKFVQRINIEESIFCDVHIERSVSATPDDTGTMLKQVVFKIVKVAQVTPPKELKSLQSKLAANPIILNGKNEVAGIVAEIVTKSLKTRSLIKKLVEDLPKTELKPEPKPKKSHTWTKMHTIISGIGGTALAIFAGLTFHANHKKAPTASHATSSHRAAPTTAVIRHTAVTRPTTPRPQPTAPTHVDQNPVQAPTSIVLQSFSPRSADQANPELALRKMLEGYHLPQSAAHIANTLTSQRPESLLSQARSYVNGELANAYATHRPDARLNTWLRGGHRIHTHAGDTFQLRKTGATVSLVHNDAQGITLYSLPLPITLPAAETANVRSGDQAASQPMLEQYRDPSSAEFTQLMDMHTDRSNQSRFEIKTYTELTPDLLASIDAQVSASRTSNASTKTYMDPSSAAYQELMTTKAPRYVDEAQRSTLIKQLDQKRTLSQRIRGFLSSILS